MHVCILKVIPKIRMTSDSRVEIRSRAEGNESRGGEGSLGTCSVGLLQQRRLIRADKGEIRRFKSEKVVCGHCTDEEGKQTGGTGRQDKQRDGGVKLKCKTSVHKNRLNTAC